MDNIERTFMKYAPRVMFLSWSILILNHMSRGLNWLPLCVVLIPLGLAWWFNNE